MEVKIQHRDKDLFGGLELLQLQSTHLPSIRLRIRLNRINFNLSRPKRRQTLRNK